MRLFDAFKFSHPHHLNFIDNDMDIENYQLEGSGFTGSDRDTQSFQFPEDQSTHSHRDNLTPHVPLPGYPVYYPNHASGLSGSRCGPGGETGYRPVTVAPAAIQVRASGTMMPLVSVAPLLLTRISYPVDPIAVG